MNKKYSFTIIKAEKSGGSSFAVIPPTTIRRYYE